MWVSEYFSKKCNYIFDLIYFPIALKLFKFVYILI